MVGVKFFNDIGLPAFLAFGGLAFGCLLGALAFRAPGKI